MHPHLSLRRVSKAFGSFQALSELSLDVAAGEFFTLLGPSGCGKTTLLKCIAGFEPITAGSIFISGRDVSATPPERRDIGFVFQNYALFPTMTVAQNVAFGLEMRKCPRDEIERRVAEALRLVGLEQLASRKPRQLSGGQQQRVALARAVVIRPSILLFDEPLSNLDAKLRVEMRMEIRRLQKASGITAIYVTHDQDEAFALSDRVMVLSEGKVQQIGAPSELYYTPQSRFVANFVGQSNLLRGRCVANRSAFAAVDFAGQILELATHAPIEIGSEATFAVRPERVEIASSNGKLRGVSMDGKVHQVEFLGAMVRFHVECDCGLMVAEIRGVSRQSAARLPGEGERVTICFAPEDCTVLSS